MNFLDNLRNCDSKDKWDIERLYQNRKADITGPMYPNDISSKKFENIYGLGLELGFHKARQDYDHTLEDRVRELESENTSLRARVSRSQIIIHAYKEYLTELKKTESKERELLLIIYELNDLVDELLDNK